MSSFPDLLTAFEEAVDALKVKLSKDPNASTTYNGEQIQSIVKDIKDEWAAIQALVDSALVFETKALMDAYTPTPDTEGFYPLAKVWNDTNTNSGVYGYSGSSWVKSPYDIANQAYQMAQDHTQQIGLGVDNIKYSTKNIFRGQDDVVSGVRILTDGSISSSVSYAITKQYQLAAGQSISISGMQALNSGIVNAIYRFGYFYASDTTPIEIISYPSNTLSAADSITYTAPQDGYIILNFPTTVDFEFQIEYSEKPTRYEDYNLLEVGVTKSTLSELTSLFSDKNIFTGLQPGFRLNNFGALVVSSSQNDCISKFIRIEHGETYTISGVDPSQSLNVATYSTNLGSETGNHIGTIDTETGQITFVNSLDDNYLCFSICLDASGKTLEDAENMLIQVEVGGVVTDYEPFKLYKAAKQALNIIQKQNENYFQSGRSQIVLDTIACNSKNEFLEDVEKGELYTGLCGAGVSSTLKSQHDKKFNNSQLSRMDIDTDNEGSYSLYVSMHAFKNQNNNTIDKTEFVPFDVPSGQFDNDNTIPNYVNDHSKTGYTHPSIAYDSAGVAGFKYWMIASILPGDRVAGDAVWEDEDIFVSNDAVTWQRIRSLYEDDKTYTTSTLRLPPNDFSDNARRHAFIPAPAVGDTIEISHPENNGKAEVDRETVIIDDLCYKHDPAILLDGGYVYIYHTYHLAYNGESAGTNTYMLLTRTNDGVNWECVRQDGTTLQLTDESATREIFTKNASGVMNHIFYGYLSFTSNPEVIRYAENDYEMLYGLNFSKRLKGTTPWSIDFFTDHPMQDVGSENHPGVFYDGTTLYLVNDKNVYYSTDRGVTLTKYDYYCLWQGGLNVQPYKFALCIGEAGKLICYQVARYFYPDERRQVEGQYLGVQRDHILFKTEFDSVADFTGRLLNSVELAYIDLQIIKSNDADETSSVSFYPGVMNDAVYTSFNDNTQLIKLLDMQLKKGDKLLVQQSFNAAFDGSVRSTPLILRKS